MNVRSLLPKIDELSAFLLCNPTDFVIITESNLDDLVCLNNFNLLNKDRRQSRGSGVCIFTKENTPCKRRTDLEDPSHECLWLWIRPYRIPIPFTGILLSAVYNPPGRPAQDQQNLSDYIVQTLDSIRNSSHNNCAVIILGDLDVSDIVSKRCVRSYTRSSQDAFGRWTSEFNWFDDPTVDDLTDHFTSSLTSAIEQFCPLKCIKFHSTDKPWITPSIKKLVHGRHRAYHNNDSTKWRHFRNRAKYEFKTARKNSTRIKLKTLALMTVVSG